MRSNPVPLAALALALTVAACTPNQVQPAPSSQAIARGVQGAPFTVQVTNDKSIPMKLSYRYGGSDVMALGTVPAGGTMSFTIPDRGSDNLEVMAADQNGGNYRREKVDIAAGGETNITLK